MNKFVKSREFIEFKNKYGLLTAYEFGNKYDLEAISIRSLIKSNLRRFEGKFYYKAFGVVFLNANVYEKVLEKEAQIKFINKNKGA